MRMPTAEVIIKSRVVTVTGPKGTLTKDFRHQALEITKVGNNIRVEKWYGTKKELACIRTCLSHIKNMMIGVTKVRTYLWDSTFYGQFAFGIRIISGGNDDERFSFRLGKGEIRFMAQLNCSYFSLTGLMLPRLEILCARGRAGVVRDYAYHVGEYCTKRRNSVSLD
jgi:hypothetical protein